MDLFDILRRDRLVTTVDFKMLFAILQHSILDTRYIHSFGSRVHAIYLPIVRIVRSFRYIG